MEQQSITNKILPMIKSIFIVDKEKTSNPIFVAYCVLVTVWALQSIFYIFAYRRFSYALFLIVVGFISIRVLCFIASKIFRDKASFKSIFFFDKMITINIVTFIYWLLLAGVIVFGILLMFRDVSFYRGYPRIHGFSYPTLNSFLLGMFQIIIGGTVVRLWSELMMVLFKINANLQFLKEVKEKELEEK